MELSMQFPSTLIQLANLYVFMPRCKACIAFVIK
jgi:hypothetical protein